MAAQQYTSLDGKVRRSSDATVTWRWMAGTTSWTLLVSVLAFWAGIASRELTPPFGSSSANGGKVDLPEDFKASYLQVAVSDNGRTLALALPAEHRTGIYRMDQVGDDTSTWDAQLVKDQYFNVRKIHLSSDGMDVLFWADWDLHTYKRNQNHPYSGISPFPPNVQTSNWFRWNSRHTVAINSDASRMAVLNLAPDTTLQIFSKDGDGIIRKDEQEIECSLFGYDCLSQFEYDDVGSILSYQWIGEGTIAVDMCTMSRCSVHIFRQNGAAGNAAWKSLKDFTRPPQGRMMFASWQDVDQKLVLTSWKGSQDKNLQSNQDNTGNHLNLTIQTWWSRDTWETPFNQTFSFGPYDLLPKHYMSFQRQPLFAKDGSVLCMVLVDTFADRPIVIELLTHAWIYHWNADAHEWMWHQTVELGPSITQVEMSGSGNRLILFERDYSFRVQDIV